jgi:DNA-nicking Smr family endonuclease
MHDQDDRDVFDAAMRDVRPLKAPNRVVLRPVAPRGRRNRPRHRSDSFERLWAEQGAAERAGDEMLFHRPSLPPRLLRRLSAGGFSIAAEIDLHGLTAAQAKVVLREFIVEAADKRMGCVRVIHGKGMRSGAQGPVLKGSAQLWLTQWDEVLAFASALPRDGGSGALYVLLKRR